MVKTLSVLAFVIVVASSALGDINYDCLKCHGYAGFQVGGEELWVEASAFDEEKERKSRYRLWVGESAFEVSQHRELSCIDCHKGQVKWPHNKGLQIRCDMACHALGKSHKEVVEVEAESAHARSMDSNGLGQSCLLCHDGAPALRGGDAQDQCRSCHPEVVRVRGKYPDTPGAFGENAHRRAPDWANVPACIDCHGSHGIVTGEEARAACFKGGCHEGNDESFSALFDHGSPTEADDGKQGGGLWLALAAMVGLFGLFHSVKG